MKRMLLFWFLTGLTVAEVSAETRTLDFTHFDQLSVGHGMHVTIRQGEAYTVQATGSPAELERLRVEQKGDLLVFSMETGWLRRGGSRISLDVTVPLLRRLDLTGGSRANVTMHIGSEPFLAKLSGGASLSGDLTCGDIEVGLSGGSEIELSGSGHRLSVDGSGGSRAKLRNFSSGGVMVELSGGSRAAVYVQGELNASLSGGSEVSYFGDPRLGSIESSGGSRVRPGS